MFRNYIAAALRNLARNKLYSFLNIAGLAVGLAAAILAFLYVRDELSYDRFLPEHERTFLLLEYLDIEKEPRIVSAGTQPELAAPLLLDVPGTVEAVTRLMPAERSLRHGEIEANEKVYWADPNVLDLLRLPLIAGDRNTALAKQQVPETLDAIDRLWQRLGDPKPLQRFFLEQHLQTLYLDVTRRGSLFAAFAAVAVIIACLGLFGLSVFNAERRTKEIGIRKAMGATRKDVLGLLLWQFTKPVLWANLLAWPLGYFAMRHWLEGFAYHIDLSFWSFLGASCLALLIAWVTVCGHAWRVVRTKLVSALRYE